MGTKKAKDSYLKGLKEKLTELVRTEYKTSGLSVTDREGISNLRNTPTIQKFLKENNITLEKINNFIAKGGIDDEKKLVTIRPSGQPRGTNRPIDEARVGQVLRQKVRESNPELAKAVDELTERFKQGAVHIDGHTPEKMQRYFDENAKLLNKLRLDVQFHNARLKKQGKDFTQRLSRGHDVAVSKGIDSPRNIFLELLSENVTKGNRYSVSPGASLVTGNPAREDVSKLKNWFADYATWLDKSENGGTGALAQRGDYSDLLEQHIRALGSEKWNDLTPTQQKLRLDAINDLTTNTEKLNQWLPSEGAQRRTWGLLSPDDAEQGLEIIDDSELAGIRKGEGLKPEVTELGPKLGGIGSDIKVPLHKQNVLKSTASDILNFTKKVIKNPVTRRVALGVGTALPLVSLPFSAQAAEDRELEAKQNPDDKLLQFQATLDRTTYELDKQALAAWQSTELLTAGVAEAGSMTTGIFSGLLDLGKWSQKVSPIPKGYEYYPGGKGIPRKIKK